MAQATIINRFGKIAGWNSLTARFFGRNVEAFNELEYHDKQSIENAYGGGEYPIGEEEGNYETENCSISLYSEELIALQKGAPGGRLNKLPATDFVSQYEYNGVIYKDILRNVRFRNNGRQVTQGNGKIVTKIDLKVSHIDWAQ